MSQLNRAAAEVALETGVHAATDITGFGILGHGHEVAHLSGVDLQLELETIPWLPGARRYAEASIFPGGMSNNKDYYEQWVNFADNITETEQLLLFDPETSGGLLMAVAPEKSDAVVAEMERRGERAWRIGTVIEGDGHIEVV